MPRWIRAALVALVLAAIAGGGVYFAFLRDSDTSNGRGGSGRASGISAAAVPGPGENAAAYFEGGPDSLLFYASGQLKLRDIVKQTDKVVGEILAPDVEAAFGSPWVAYTINEAAGGQTDEDFVQAPVLHLYNPETDDDVAVGPGLTPVWNATGTRVAFLRPAEPRDCSGEECAGKAELVVVDPDTGDEGVVLEPGGWTLLMWSGDRVLVSDPEDLTKTVAVSMDGATRSWDVPPNEIWDASPDGNWFVRTFQGETRMVPIEDGEPAGKGKKIKTKGALGQGGWAPDSSAVAALVSDTQGAETQREVLFEEVRRILRGDTPDSLTALLQMSPKQLVKLAGSRTKALKVRDLVRDSLSVTHTGTTSVQIFGPDQRVPRMVEQSAGVSGKVLWSPGGADLVFVRLADPAQGVFQATYCPVSAAGSCRVSISWTEDVQLLRVE